MTREYNQAAGLERRNAIDFTADRAVEIYERKYKEDFEKLYRGNFVVIDVHSEKAYMHESSAGAYQEARKAAPLGLFYMLRVGSVHTVSL